MTMQNAFAEGRALVVGVGAHGNAAWDVPTAGREAAAIVEALSDPQVAGYAAGAVELLVDAEADQSGVTLALRRLADRCQEDSVALFCFTGHGGLSTDDDFMLATAGATFDEAGRISGGLRLGGLIRALRLIPARQVLVVLNTCFAGHAGLLVSADDIAYTPLFQSAATLDEGHSKQLAAEGDGRALLMASRPGQRSHLMVDQPLSYFGQAVIDALRSGAHGLFSFYEAVHRQVRGVVERNHGQPQEPLLTLLQGAGPFPIARRAGAPAAAPADQALPADLAIQWVTQDLIAAAGAGSAAIKAEAGSAVNSVSAYAAEGSTLRAANTLIEGGVHIVAAQSWQRPNELPDLLDWQEPIGRAREQADLWAALDPAKGRRAAIAIGGAAGIGKTTLATRYAQERGAAYTGGVLWATLGPTITEPAHTQAILDTWASYAHGGIAALQALIGSRRDVVTPALVRRQIAGHGPLLVVIDDCPNAAVLEHLMAALPDETALIVIGEDRAVFQGRVLDVIDLAGLEQPDALALLQRYLSTDDPQLLGRLARGYAGHPLALTQTATRLRQQLDAQLRGKALADTVDYLEGVLSKPSAADLQVDLPLHAIRGSYEELGRIADGPRYQRCIRLLNIPAPTRADFDTAMAAAIWDEPYPAAAEALQVLNGRSLINRVADGRWALSPLLPLLVRDLPIAGDEAEAAQARYLAYVRDRVSRLREADGPTGLTQALGRDLPHVLYAFDLIALNATARMSADDLRQIDSIATLVEVDFGDQRGLGWLRAAERLAETLGDEAALLNYLRMKGNWHSRRGQYDEAAGAYSRGLERARATRRPTDAAFFQYYLGKSYQLQGRTREAADTLSAALKAYEQAMTPWVRLNLTYDLGHLLIRLGDTQRAEEILLQALELARVNSEDEVIVLSDLAELRAKSFRLDEALPLFYRSLDQIKAVGNRRMEAVIRENMADALMEGDQPQEALEQYEIAATIARAEDLRLRRIWSLDGKAMALSALNRTEDALRAFDEVIALTRKLDERQLLAIFVLQKARVLTQNGRHDDAISAVESIVEDVERIGDQDLLSRCYSVRAEVAAAQERIDSALEAYTQAWEIVVNRPPSRRLVSLLYAIGHLYEMTYRAAEGAAFFRKRLPDVERMGYRAAELVAYGWTVILLAMDRQDRTALELFGQKISHAPDEIETIVSLGEKLDVLHVLGVANMVLGYRKEALALFDRALSYCEQTGNQMARLELLSQYAHLHLLANDLAASQRYLDDALPLADHLNQRLKLANLLIQRSVVASRSKEFDAAARLIDRALAIIAPMGAPHRHVEALLRKSSVELNRRRPADALPPLDEAIAIARPTEDPALISVTTWSRGFVLVAYLNQPEGIEQVEQALKLMTAKGVKVDLLNVTVEGLTQILEGLRANLGKAPFQEAMLRFVKTTGWEFAQRMLTAEQVTLLNPAIDEIFSIEITLCEQSGDRLLANVLRQYREAIKRARDNPDEAFEQMNRQLTEPGANSLYHWWGKLQRGAGDYLPALKNLNRAIELKRDEGRHYIERGWIYRGLGQYKLAQDDFDTAARSQQCLGQANAGRGAIQFELGRYDRAISNFNEALRQGANPYVYQWRATAYQELGRFDEALADIEHAIARQNDIAAHYYWRALIQLDRHDPAAALDSLSRCREIDHDRPEALSYDLIWSYVAHTLRDDKSASANTLAAARTQIEALAPGDQRKLAEALLQVIVGDHEPARAAYAAAFTANVLRHVLNTQRRHILQLARLFPERADIVALADWTRATMYQ